ncbi:MAG TPA: PAS domain-containing protein [Thermoanaerobaculaceae bacterium]|nr:PAS domain-containing protein [Thermoanaerobaculaceae bacterium]
MADVNELGAATLDALDDPIVVVDRDLRVVSCNRTFQRWNERLRGLPCPVGSPVAETLAFLSPLVLEDLKAVFATGSAVVTEETVGLGGTATTFEIRRAPVWTDGEVAAAVMLIRDVTTQRTLLDALRLKDAAIELSASGIALCDEAGTVTYANRSFVAMWGCSDAGGLMGESFGSLWQARDAAETAMAALRDRGAWSGELMARRHDGSVFASHLSASLVRGSDGSPVCSMAVVSDLSERIRMEEALAESEATLRTILDTDPDDVFLVGPDGYVLIANTAAGYDLHRPLGEVLGQPISDLLTHDEGELVRSHCDVAARTGRTVRFEASAGARVYDYRICPIADGRGGVATLAVFRQDTTDRANADAALREANRAQHALIEAAPFAIVGLSREGLVRLWNRTAESWFGWSEAQAVGHRFAAVPHEAEPAFREILARVARGEKVQTADVVYRRRDGRPIELMLSVAPVFGADGKVTDAVLVAADTTERNRMQARLVDAQKMDAVGRLASGVAHDFNNLLQAILSLVEVLKIRSASPDRVAAAARSLEERALQGATLTRHLTLLSRRVGPRVEPLDLAAVVAKEAEVLRTMLPANIAIEQESEADALAVLGDSEQLGHVVMNLATNAAAAMPDGGRLALRTGRAPDGHVWLEVRDTGAGIPMPIRDRVFEPFFTTKDPARSSGLGLTVARDIVTRHRGRIRFESGEGAGTTFWVELPAAVHDGAPATGQAAALPAAVPAPGRGERVLLVEDETAAREGLSEMLRMLRYDVTAVASGEMAGLLPPDPAFDVLVTDVMLPGAAGTDLAQGLRERWPALKVVLISGYTVNEARRLGRPLESVRFLEKPFDMATLAREMRGVLDERSA